MQWLGRSWPELRRGIFGPLFRRRDPLFRQSLGGGTLGAKLLGQGIRRLRRTALRHDLLLRPGGGAAAAFMGRRGAMGAGFATGWAGRTGAASSGIVSGALVNSPEMRGNSLPPMPKRSRQLRLSVSFVEF